ncbi:SDR family oxidoreductase [Cytobacillus dafuensis]|uniref:NAD-dependent epimerase/dehydratase family protein n=1 Tax=Cytobacillus dafuensis TaxID=1742359 RepID=A0A5B8Z999_CYTDA|nr:NmrA family NAD(P)-binding protein [Cytobacillus dafuensis]QED48026.1 NAD-dependent epimerase/dehydratase family protein [Cytobacillus dafuensis]
MATKDKVLVYGAGGVQGGAVARKLLKEGHTVHTIVRSSDKAAQLQEQGISAFVGDLSDADSLTSAHNGVSKVFLLLPVNYDLERNRQFIRNTVDAAKKANVKLLVINTSGIVPDDATDVAVFEIKRELIAYVKQSGIPFIILKPTLYMENFLIPGVVGNQTLAYPVPADLAIAWISMEDMAAYGVYALNHPELAGQTLYIVGPEALTGNQLAEQFSAALDQEIQFFSLPVEAFEEAIGPVLGKETAAGLADTYKWTGLNIHSLPKPEQVIDEMRIAVPGTPLVDWVKQAVQQGYFATDAE